jgi:hypothetical protein
MRSESKSPCFELQSREGEEKASECDFERNRLFALNQVLQASTLQLQYSGARNGNAYRNHRPCSPIII